MHVIQHLRIEAQAADQPSARRLQDDLSRWCRSEVFWQRVSDKLDEFVPDNRVLQVEKIEIDIDAADEESFLEAVFEQLIGEVVQSLGLGTVSRVEHVRQQALYFLTHGYMPTQAADADATHVKLFLESLADAADPIFAEMFGDRVPENPNIIARLVQHLGILRARMVLMKLFLEVLRIALSLSEIERLLSQYLLANELQARSSQEFKIRFWQNLFKENTSRSLTNETELTEALNRISSSENGFERSHTADNEPVNVDSQAVFYIKNAGFVLLAPFLPQLFKALQWTTRNDWTDDEKAHLAVRLIGHICSGTDEDWEYNWVLAKILCGLSPETVINQEQPLDKAAIDLSVQMVEAAIDQWKVLKTMSADGLREMFLLRDGKLSRDGEGTGWRLQVEKKAQDVLLERIPWGFSVIRLPWMRDMLFVEW
ncbi:contractile injection system tape measure protein [Dyadobacter sp. MSC1_007]|jgi:hypothetical protein|uniref:contractile injection system tape measure protein n=1 Tax=Dyadobacter sp. MSC1_007 TaxID=2909264 RepID=UPI00203056E3|nr:contractile injection system tape measure protein [Dyadobacter sp. MSC1_007]